MYEILTIDIISIICLLFSFMQLMFRNNSYAYFLRIYDYYLSLDREGKDKQHKLLQQLLGHFNLKNIWI